MLDQPKIQEDIGGAGFFTIVLPPGAPAEQRDFERQLAGVQDVVRANPSLKGSLLELQQAALLGLKGANGQPPDLPAAIKQVDGLNLRLTTTLKNERAPATTAGGAAAGAFYVTLPLKQDPTADPRGLLFRMKDGISSVPADQMVLKDTIEDTLITLQVVFPEHSLGWGNEAARVSLDRRYMQYRTKLQSLAQVGLQSEPAFPAVATQALNTLRAEVVTREASRVKNGYMKSLGWWTIGFATAITVAYFIFRFYPSISPTLHYYQNLFVLLTGCVLGTWLSFGARRVVLAFSDLGHLEKDSLEPGIRLVFVGLFTLVLGLIFVCDIVDVKIGSFTTDLLLVSGPHALLIGLFCGISEQALPAAVSQKAGQFLVPLHGDYDSLAGSG